MGPFSNSEKAVWRRVVPAAAACAIAVSGCTDDGPEHKPWFGYATHIQRQELEPWWIGFKTHRDCVENMKAELASAPNNQWYREPYGCAYSGNSRLLSFILNWIYVGSDLYCIARNTDPDADKKFARYLAVIKVKNNVRAGKGTYCIGPFDALI